MILINLFQKTILIAMLISICACATTAPEPELRWLDFPAESVQSITGMWINEGGFLRYQIKPAEDPENQQKGWFELIEHSYCPDGDCSKAQPSEKGRQIYGTIKDGKISAFYIHQGKEYKQLWPRMINCKTLAGKYSVGKVTLSPNGQQLFLKIFIPDTNPNCSSPEIVFYLLR